MDADEQEMRQQRSRETFVALLLSFALGGGFLLFLIFVSGGFFFYVLLISGALGVFGCFHYLLWGWVFERSVKKEREELQWEQEAKQTLERAPWERRF